MGFLLGLGAALASTLFRRRATVAGWTAGELAAQSTCLLERLVRATQRAQSGVMRFRSQRRMRIEATVRQSSLRVTSACGVVIAAVLLGFLLWYEGTLKDACPL